MTRDDIKELVCRDCKGLSVCHGDGDGFTACSIWLTADRLNQMGLLTDMIWDAVLHSRGCCSSACEKLVEAMIEEWTEKVKLPSDTAGTKEAR